MNAECTYFVLGFHPLKWSNIGSSSAPQGTTAVAATVRGNEVYWSRHQTCGSAGGQLVIVIYN